MTRSRPAYTRRDVLAIGGAGAIAFAGCTGGDGGDDSVEQPLPEPAAERGFYDPVLTPLRSAEIPGNVLRIQAFEGETVREYREPFDSYLLLFENEVLGPLQIEEPAEAFDRVVFATPPNADFFAYAILDGVPMPTEFVPLVVQSGSGLDSAHVHEEGSHGGFELYSSSRSAISRFAIADDQVIVVPGLGDDAIPAGDLLTRVIDTWNWETGSLLRENESARRLFEEFSTSGATVAAIRLADGTGGDGQYVPPGARAGGIGVSGEVDDVDGSGEADDVDGSGETNGVDEDRRLRYVSVYPAGEADRDSFETFLADEWGPDLGLGLSEPTIEGGDDVLVATDGHSIADR